MEGNPNFEKLKEHILLKSKASSFSIASKEWRVMSIVLSDDSTHCPCGQEIWERCFIINIVTGARTMVGNVCIKHFMGVDMSPTFTGVKKIKKDRSKSPNKALIEYAVQHGLVNDWETQFLMGTLNKRKLSEKQFACRDRINNRILMAVSEEKENV